MNNKWLQSGIAVLLWGYLAKHVINNESLIGNLFNNIASGFLPEQILGISGVVVLFGVFTVIYVGLAYFAIFYAERKSDE